MYINATVFLCGAILMALEMLGSRILAPFFGHSIAVWGSLISVFLAALSVGYLQGGRLADRKPDLAILSYLIMGAGVYVWFIPFFAATVCSVLLALFPGYIVPPLLACIVLFFIPGVLMGMVSPYAIKLAAQEIENVGGLAGRLYAISTAGSILGTLAGTFVMVQFFGVRASVHFLGAALFFLALPPLGVQLSSRLSRGASLGIFGFTILFSTLIVSQFPLVRIPGQRIVFQQDSYYGHVAVTETDQYRILLLDHVYNTAMDLKNKVTGFDYANDFLLAVLFQPKMEKALFIGVGGGTAPRLFRELIPKLKIDAVEIDPVVCQVARDHFNWVDAPDMRLINQDGRRFVQQSQETYDLIAVDAYSGGMIPFHLTTQEFWQEVKARLSPKGVLLINAIDRLEPTPNEFIKALHKTVGTVFPQQYLYPINSQPDKPANLLMIATDWQKPMTTDDVYGKSILFQRYLSDRFPTINLMSVAEKTLAAINVGNAPLLTDDYAPVDTLLGSMSYLIHQARSAH